MATKQPRKLNQNKKPTDPPKKEGDPKATFQWKRAGKTSLVWLLIVVGAILISGVFTNMAFFLEMPESPIFFTICRNRPYPLGDTGRKSV